MRVVLIATIATALILTACGRGSPQHPVNVWFSSESETDALAGFDGIYYGTGTSHMVGSTSYVTYLSVDLGIRTTPGYAVTIDRILDLGDSLQTVIEVRSPTQDELKQTVSPYRPRATAFFRGNYFLPVELQVDVGVLSGRFYEGNWYARKFLDPHQAAQHFSNMYGYGGHATWISCAFTTLPSESNDSVTHSCYLLHAPDGTPFVMSLVQGVGGRDYWTVESILPRVGAVPSGP